MKFTARCTKHNVSLKVDKWVSAYVENSTFDGEPCWQLSMGGFRCPANISKDETDCEGHWEFTPIDEYEVYTAAKPKSKT